MAEPRRCRVLKHPMGDEERITTLTARVQKLEAALRDTPTNEDMDAAQFQVNSLTAQVATLTRERNMYREMAVEGAKLLSKLETLTTALQAAREGLKRYGRHEEGCRAGVRGHGRGRCDKCACDCGLDAVLGTTP